MKTWIVLLASAWLASSQETILVKPKPGSDTQIAALIANRGCYKFRHLNWYALDNADPRTFRNSGLFDYVEPNRLYSITRTPNDPLYAQQWGMSKIQAPLAWDSFTSNSVVVAVIDTGIDFAHPDLQANLWTGPDGEHGYTFGGSTDGGLDDHGHGTHVAGIIGAVGNNGVGVVGVNWKTRILSLKFLANDGYGFTVDALKCVDKMIDLKKRGVNIRVSNNSWGGGFSDLALQDAFAEAGANGIINICAAGNGNADTDINVFSPAGMTEPSIVSVLASDTNDGKASFSNYGIESTDLLAPGVDILSTVLQDHGYTYFNGTSMASPHVAGTCAALFGRNPALTVKQCKNVLMDPRSFDRTTVTLNASSGGRLNLAKTLSNPAIFAPSSNRPPTLSLSESILHVYAKTSGTMTASGQDPNGDPLLYGVTLAVPSFDGGLIDRVFANRFPPLFTATNRVTVSNASTALDFGVNPRFETHDIYAESAKTNGTVFLWRDSRVVTNLAAPSVQLTGDELLVGGSGLFSYHLQRQNNLDVFWCCGTSGIPVRLAAPLSGGADTIRVHIMDAFGNFVNADQLVIRGGSSTASVPQIDISINTRRGIAPLTVVADMSATGATYFKWVHEDVDFFNPVKVFTLREPGIYKVDFIARDAENATSDVYEAIFSVLPSDSGLMIRKVGQQVELTWKIPQPTRIESSADLMRWAAIYDGPSPFTITATGNRFFRLLAL